MPSMNSGCTVRRVPTKHRKMTAMREKTEQQAAPMGEIGAEEKEERGGREGEGEKGGGRGCVRRAATWRYCKVLGPRMYWRCE